MSHGLKILKISKSEKVPKTSRFAAFLGKLGRLSYEDMTFSIWVIVVASCSEIL